MFFTISIKLIPNETQQNQLLETMERFNDACNYISQKIFETKRFNKIEIQKLYYHQLREKFCLPSQLVIRSVGKTIEMYKQNKEFLITYEKTDHVIYDHRILSFKGLEYVSIMTLQGRIEIPMQIMSYEVGTIKGKRVKGQADLMWLHNKLYLFLVVEFSEEQVPLTLSCKASHM